jgi:hypothetical protein
MIFRKQAPTDPGLYWACYPMSGPLLWGDIVDVPVTCEPDADGQLNAHLARLRPTKVEAEGDDGTITEVSDYQVVIFLMLDDSFGAMAETEATEENDAVVRCSGNRWLSGAIKKICDGEMDEELIDEMYTRITKLEDRLNDVVTGQSEINDEMTGRIEPLEDTLKDKLDIFIDGTSMMVNSKIARIDGVINSMGDNISRLAKRIEALEDSKS